MKNTNNSPGWRVGDAGHTVFGPNLGAISPEVVATNIRKPVNARFIVHAVNNYLPLLEALRDLLPILDNDGPLPRAYDDVGIRARTAIVKAEAQ